MKSNVNRVKSAKQRRTVEANYWLHVLANEHMAINALNAKCKNWHKRYPDMSAATVVAIKAKRAAAEAVA